MVADITVCLILALKINNIIFGAVGAAFLTAVSAFFISEANLKSNEKDNDQQPIIYPGTPVDVDVDVLWGYHLEKIYGVPDEVIPISYADCFDEDGNKIPYLMNEYLKSPEDYFYKAIWKNYKNSDQCLTIIMTGDYDGSFRSMMGRCGFITQSDNQP